MCVCVGGGVFSVSGVGVMVTSCMQPCMTWGIFTGERERVQPTTINISHVSYIYTPLERCLLYGSSRLSEGEKEKASRHTV